jgi:hypothetical protein
MYQYLIITLWLFTVQHSLYEVVEKTQQSGLGNKCTVYNINSETSL